MNWPRFVMITSREKKNTEIRTIFREKSLFIILGNWMIFGGDHLVFKGTGGRLVMTIRE